MFKTLGRILTVIACFVAGIATLVAGYWIGIFSALIFGAFSLICIVAAVVGVVVFSIIEALTMKDDEPDEDDPT